MEFGSCRVLAGNTIPNSWTQPVKNRVAVGEAGEFHPIAIDVLNKRTLTGHHQLSQNPKLVHFTSKELNQLVTVIDRAAVDKHRSIILENVGVSGLEVQINTDGSRIEGIARIEGQPARPGVLVVLAPPPTRRQNRALYKVAFTDSGGRFAFRGVPPGEFKLFAWNVTPIGAYKNDAFLARFESSGQTVRVPQDTTVTVPVSIVESYFAR